MELEPVDLGSRQVLFKAYCDLLDENSRLKAELYVLKELLKAKETK